MTPRRRQRGAALLLLLVVVVIAFTTALVSGFGKWETPATARRNVNAEVLAKAKAALIGYVVKEVLDLGNDVPGLLPCPEFPGDAGDPVNEGRKGNFCDPSYASAKNIGRLPWRELGVDRLVDAAGEPLWYAVSPGWVMKAGSPSPIPPLINAGTDGQLSFDNTSHVVAVIFAPGRPLTVNPTSAQIAAGCVARSQSRNDRSHVSGSAADPDYRDYLECQNASSPIDGVFGTTVAGNDGNEVINDQAVFVTAAELLNAIQGPLAERLQRTVAPLLSEYSKSWIGSGTILPTANDVLLPRFMPYAAPFIPPEQPIGSTQDLCGSASAPTREGLLPLAAMAQSGACASPWGSFAWSGSVGGTSCTTDPTSGAVTCQFNYYTLRSINFPFIGSLNLFQLLGLAVPTKTNVTLQATAPYAAATFRKMLRASDFTISPVANVSKATFTQTPSQTDGSVRLSLNLEISSAAICEDKPNAAPTLNIVCSSLTTLGSVCNAIPLLSGFCSLLGGVLTAALTDSHQVAIQFPALSDPVDLLGAQIPSALLSKVVLPLKLLAPIAGTSTPETDSSPHYWFFANQWYRYTYYAISPSASAAGTGNIRVKESPDASTLDKQFVLVMMGPALTSQTAFRPSTDVRQYLEGDNNSINDDTFAYQVYSSASGNDRLAACPFVFTATGSSVCE